MLYRNRDELIEFMVIATYLLVVFYLEMLLPRVFIWIKWGFSNAFLLYLITKKYPFIWYIFLVVLKSIVGGIVSGSLFTPIFLFSLSGGMASFLIMYVMYKTGLFSLIPISIYGSFMSNITQLYVAYSLGILKDISLFVWWVGLISIITGSITGIVAVLIKRNEFTYDKYMKMS